MIPNEKPASKNTLDQQEWLEITNLKKVYGDFVAINDINLTINKGEFLTLLGASGSGKTTVLLSIAGFLEPSVGKISLSGESILDKPPHKRNIGMVFQQYSLFPHMSIFENIAFPLKMRKYSKSEIRTRVDNILKLVELEQFANRKPSQLSGGQQQRVALARALVYEPTILLMDEPLAALDKNLRETMQEEIWHLHKKLGLTIIYVTHDQKEALEMSDRIAIFKKGSIVQIGTPSELYDRPNSQFVAQFLGDSSEFHGKVSALDNGVVTVSHKLGSELTASTFQKFNNGENVVVMVRPEKVRIIKIKDSKQRTNIMEAKVEKVVYLGESYRYILTTPSGETVLVKKQINLVNEEKFETGDIVYITWDQENAIVLPSDVHNVDFVNKEFRDREVNN
jgi:putative spermidine/putrescine transport system ATP-binding protein